MTYKEILEREDSNINRIYLYREGQFLKAYEHSAFLFHRYVSPFKLSYRYVKQMNRNIVSLGFPLATAQKWLYGLETFQMGERLWCVNTGKSIDEIEYQNWLELARVQANPGDRYTTYTSVIENQPVYKTAYDALSHILDFSKNVEKNLREPYAVKAKQLSYDITFSIRMLYDVSDREEQIDKIVAWCKELVFVLQVLKDMRQISLDAFALCSERIVSVSKQLEGLRRTATA